MPVEITDELAELALRTYVQGLGGHPRDAMRKAIETALGTFDAAELLATDDADVRMDAAYQRGWTAGNAALDIIEQREATDYEVWRDALRLSVALGQASPSNGRVGAQRILDDAEWFHGQLLSGLPAARDVLGPANVGGVGAAGPDGGGTDG